MAFSLPGHWMPRTCLKCLQLYGPVVPENSFCTKHYPHITLPSTLREVLVFLTGRDLGIILAFATYVLTSRQPDKSAIFRNM